MNFRHWGERFGSSLDRAPDRIERNATDLLPHKQIHQRFPEHCGCVRNCDLSWSKPGPLYNHHVSVLVRRDVWGCRTWNTDVTGGRISLHKREVAGSEKDPRRHLSDVLQRSLHHLVDGTVLHLHWTDLQWYIFQVNQFVWNWLESERFTDRSRIRVSRYKHSGSSYWRVDWGNKSL